MSREASTQPSPPTTTSPPSLTSPSPPTGAISHPAPSVQTFMPLREVTPVTHQSLTTQSHPPDNFSSEHVPAEDSPREIFHPTVLDPGASTSGEYNRKKESPYLPHSLSSTSSSSHELFPTVRDSRPKTYVDTSEVTAPLPMPQAESPTTRLTAEGTPIADQATSASTMTPPMSPPKVKGLFPSSSSTKVRLATDLKEEFRESEDTSMRIRATGKIN